MKSWVILGVCMILMNQALAEPDNSADAWLAVINNDVQNEVVEQSEQEQPAPQQYNSQEYSPQEYSPQDLLQRQFEKFEAPSQRQAPDYTDVEAQPVQPPAPQPQPAVQDVYQQQYPPPRRNVPQTRRGPPPALRNAPHPGATPIRPRPGPNNRLSPGGASQPGSRRRPRPRPRPGNNGGILSGIGQGIKNIQDGIQCAASDLWADSKLQDPKFVDAQMKCLLNEGPCDETGKLVKRLAPDILAKRCPPPCTPCIMKKIRGMMAKVQRENPQLWSKMIQQIATRPG